MPGRVLILEDDETLRGVLVEALRSRGHEPRVCEDADDALDEDDGTDVALVDLELAATEGTELCARLHAQRPDRPVLVMTAFGSVPSAVAAMRAGAWDFLTKPLDPEVLGVAVERALEHARLRSELDSMKRRLRQAPRFEDIVGESPRMRRLYDLIERVATAPSSVLITGESGTGKELVARALHRRSPRSDAAFVALNCAAVPETLLESELFGHVRGAFTDARQPRDGLFVQARGGTLFLDEIGDMPLGLQPKLLRVLQERVVRPLGSEREIEVDVRVLAATHQDVDSLVARGQLREDLLYRLDVVRIELPPLRRRGHDVLLLAQRFLEQQAERLGRDVVEIGPEAARALMAYDWPGNVRELANCMERAVLLARGPTVTPDDLPPRVGAARSRAPAEGSTELLTLDEVQRRHVRAVLKACGGQKAPAARALGIDRKTLYRMLERWGDTE